MWEEVNADLLRNAQRHHNEEVGQIGEIKHWNGKLWNGREEENYTNNPP